MTPEQIQEITQLRSLNLSPKQIARKLGLRPAEVTSVLQDQAQGHGGITRKELPPIEQCFVNKDAVQALLRSSKKGLLGWGKPAPKDDHHGSGFAQIVVTRRDGRDYILCAYLVDYWCLGVKDCLGPRKMDHYKYEQMLSKIYSTMESGYCEITFTEAQSIIWGALDYAKALGFDPHQDFARAKPHLGDRPEQLIELEFGRDGKPFYFSGPYDNPRRIIETLRKTVGEGNFHYTCPIEL